MVQAYAVTVSRVLRWLARILGMLFRRGSGEDTLAVALVVVNRALWTNWGLVCAMLDGEAMRVGALGAVLPSPQLMTMGQLRGLVEDARAGGADGFEERVVRNVDWAVHTMTRRTVRRAATGDEGVSGEALSDLSKARRAAAAEEVAEAKIPRDGFEPVLTAEEVAWAEETDRLVEAAVAARESDYYTDEEIADIIAGRDLGVRESGQSRVVRWARVIRGEYTCGFCIMLASRGAVYRTKKTASVRRKSYGKYRDEFNTGGSLMDGLDGSFHYHCDCEVVPVFDVNHWVGKAEAGRLYDLWTEGPGDIKGFSKWIEDRYESGWQPEGALSPLLPDDGSTAA